MPDSTNTPALPELQRYELELHTGSFAYERDQSMEKDNDGTYVLYEAHAARLESTLQALSEACKERDALRVSNHRLSRERDRLFSRRIVDSGAKVWLPYWRACKRWLKQLEQRAQKAEAELTEARTLLANQAAEIEALREKDARDKLQVAVHEWACAAFGSEQASSVPQRGIRLFEEGAETAQAAGVERGMAHKMVDYVWDRPAGSIAQELGGVGVTALALAQAAGLSADECERNEVARVLAKPLAHFTARNQAKNDAGFVAPPTPGTN